MSEKRSTKTTLLIGLMMFALFSPILNSASAVEESDNHPKSDEPKGVIHGDLRDFNPSEVTPSLLSIIAFSLSGSGTRTTLDWL